MPERLIYSDEHKGSTPLGPALRLLGLETLQKSTIQHLYTSGLGNLQDRYATGIGGRHRDLTWMIRWDWDETKGEHVNVVLTRDKKGTEKIAYLSARRSSAATSSSSLKSNTKPANVAYMLTIQQFTMNCQFDINKLRKFAGHQASESAEYKRQCAENGRVRWCYALKADLEAEKERAEYEAERKKLEKSSKERGAVGFWR
jgi:hypothetical protein